MKSVWQNTCLFEKRPKLRQETSGTTFFKAQSQIFFGISKKKLFRHKHYLQDNHKKLFFGQKSLEKKVANKIRRKILSKKKLIRVYATEYEIYVTKYLLVWKKTQVASGNIRNNVF